MTSKKHLRQWEDVVEILQRRPLEFRDMTEKVLSRLEFSYSSLPSEIHKKCFLYCSLFPEDFEIEVDDLVDLWIGEGFVDTSIGINRAREHCEEVIDDLISSCLLESNFSRFPIKILKMHDLIRDMAKWIASGHGNANGKVLLPENHRSIALHEFERWKDAEIISVMLEDTEVKEFPSTLTCLHLCTLILRNTNIESFPGGFFSSMPSLKVLDLMSNEKLREIPTDIGCLPNLEYLNLTQTNVTKLPKEFKNLIRLRLLFLERGVYIPKGILLDLPSLRVCVFSSVAYFRHTSIPEEEKPKLNLLEELNNMKEGSEVSLSLMYASEVEKLQRSPKLQSCIRNLFIQRCEALTSARLSASRMKHMVQLIFLGCRSLEEIHIRESGIGKDDESGDEEELQSPYYYSACASGPQVFDFHNLRHLVFYDCERISHLTSLILCAPNLEVLILRGCNAMTEIVKGDIPENQVNRIFSCLTFLDLEFLPELKGICGRPLPFASLKKMRVFGCETLKKLPFDSNSFPNDTLESIESMDEEWWEGLEWDHDPPTKQLLAPKFKNYFY